MSELSASLPPSRRRNLKFSNGWLFQLKKCDAFKAYKRHREDSDADESAIATHLPIYCRLLSAYRPNDILNADEFGLFYSKELSITTVPAHLRGRKKRKDRITFLLCGNADRTERIPPLVLGTARRLRRSRRKEGQEFLFDYQHSRKAWMNRDILTDWLMCFAEYIRSTPGTASCY